jgi:hypothetical protein
MAARARSAAIAATGADVTRTATTGPTDIKGAVARVDTRTSNGAQRFTISIATSNAAYVATGINNSVGPRIAVAAGVTHIVIRGDDWCLRSDLSKYVLQ